MKFPDDFAERVAESRAKHLAPAIGAVLIGPGGRIESTVHGGDRQDAAATWHIGSCTKSMTATLFARLVDQSQIGFDTPLAEALPELAPKMAIEFREVPVRDLLTHSASIPRDPDRSTFLALRRSSAPVSDQRRFLASQALKELPRSGAGYSNLGYIVLGAVIERAAQRPWEQALAREVMIPLGISRFGFGPPGRQQMPGHRRIGNRWQAERGDNPQAYGPAGRVHIALDEWGRFLRAHLGPSRLLAEATRETLHSPGPSGFAMGWRAGRWRGERTLFHTGSNTAWFAQATLLPERGIGFGIACNAFDERIERAVNDLSIDLMNDAIASTP